MPKSYKLEDNTTIKISDDYLGEGGEGGVYQVISPKKFQNKVAKILLNDKRTTEKMYRIKHMIQYPPITQDANGHTFLIWPEYLLFDGLDFVGFIMPKAEGIELENLCLTKLFPEHQNDWGRFDRQNQESYILRSKLCKNIAIAVHTLHSTGKYVIGDLKPANILVQLNGLVSILDLDSCQITEKGKVRFESKMATPEFSPPDKTKDKKEVSWDNFILAIIFYRLLCGIHPFTGTCSPPNDVFTTTDQKIKEGLFPLGSKSKCFSVIPQEHNLIYNYLEDVKNAFIECFDDGIYAPNLRPTAKEWIDALTSEPIIEYFVGDKPAVIGNMAAILTWKVKNAHKIEIDNGIGDVTNKDKISVIPSKITIYTIKAIGYFGEAEETTTISVFPIPIIESLWIETPDFTNTINLSAIQIESPKIHIPIAVDFDFHISTPQFIKLDQEIGEGILRKNNSFWIIFNELRDKILKNITNKQL